MADNPDADILLRPVTDEELSAYKSFMRDHSARVSRRSFAEVQVASNREAAAAALKRLEGMSESDSDFFSMREAAALGVAKGYGDVERALALAPAQAEVLRLKEAIERPDGDLCRCHAKAETMPVVEHVFHSQLKRIVALTRCQHCGHMNTRFA